MQESPQHVIQKMKGTKTHGKDSQVRGDYKSKVPKCEVCEIPGHQTKDCFHLRTAKAAVASKKRGADSGKERHSSSNNRKKTRVTIDDSDNNGDESNVLLEEVNTAINTDEEVYLDCACNMILTSKEHMKNLRRVDKEMTTANKGKLKIRGIRQL